MSISAISSGIYPNFQSSCNSLPETRKNQPGKAVEELSSKDFGIAETKNKDDIKYGFLGDKDADVYYIPPNVLAQMPKISDNIVTLADVAEGRVNDISTVPLNMRGGISSEASKNISRAWNEFYTLLEKHGVDYRDSKSFNDFMKNDNLKNEIEKSLSIQV